jgi:hypothetical protein
MPSQINSLVTNIDEDYPVAGVDNDSQGFRDNFDIIKTSLAFAGQEITELQDTTAKITGDNDFSGNLIINADLSGVTENAIDLAPFTSVSPEINVIKFREGSYQKVTVSLPDTSSVANIEFQWGETELSTLEADRYAKVILEIATDSEDENEYEVIFSNPDGSVKFSNNFPYNFKATVNPQLIEVSTRTGGDEIFVEYLGEYLPVQNLLSYYNYQSTTQGITTSVSTEISLEVMSTYFETAASGSFSATLPAGDPGQLKTLIMKQDGGQDMTVAVADPGWVDATTGSIVFTALGQSCTLQFVENKWYCIGNNGATFA